MLGRQILQGVLESKNKLGDNCAIFRSNKASIIFILKRVKNTNQYVYSIHPPPPKKKDNEAEFSLKNMCALAKICFSREGGGGVSCERGRDARWEF